MGWRRAVMGFVCVVSTACSASGSGDVPGGGVDTGSDPDGGLTDASSTDSTGATDTLASDTTSSGDTKGDASSDVSTADADAAPPADDLSGNRDRLLESYFTYLKASVTTPQTNGLSGSTVTSVCDLWTKLAPSSQEVFLSLTHRMQGSRLRVDGSSMLSHVVKIYRLVGGDGATATSTGGCGGAEFNRMIMSMDAVLQRSMLDASLHKGARQSDGKYDISDVVPSSFWRDTHDAGGTHAPFDISDETDGGAPRGQTQYFKDPTSTLAKSPLGRQDLATLVDPFALEMDQDYDCVHNSNPSCSYVTYGAACLPKSSKKGLDIYRDNYGDVDPTWKPKGCGP